MMNRWILSGFLMTLWTASTSFAGVDECSQNSHCDDFNPCTRDVCILADPRTCVNTPLSTGTCNDGNACTSSDHCSNGACVGGGAPPNCDDSNFCTDDVCDPLLGCVHLINRGPCDDRNACTSSDRCQNGACVGTPANCDDGNGCTTDTCNPATGCVFTNNSEPCSDGNACTTTDTCSGGACVGGAPPNCDDSNVCTDDFCVPLVGCVHGINSDPCDDRNACTTNDTCAGGACVGGAPPDCDDDNVCTDDSCDPATGCVLVDNTAPCDDGRFCTVEDVCISGECGGSPRDCSEVGDQCLPGVCIEATDLCEPQPAEDGTSCDDGDTCTSNDRCISGGCRGEQAFGLDEWRQFTECYDGVGVPVEVGCECFDLDGDGEVHLQDVSEFMLRFNGN